MMVSVTSYISLPLFHLHNARRVQLCAHLPNKHQFVKSGIVHLVRLEVGNLNRDIQTSDFDWNAALQYTQP